MQVHDLYLQALAALHVALALVVIVDLLKQHRAPATTIAWILALLLLPYAGLALYFFAGAPRKHGTRLGSFLRAHVDHRNAAPADACSATEPLLRALGLPGATCGNHLKLCASNESAAEELLRVIDSAERRLFLSVFSFEHDVMGTQIVERLKARARAGVEVRILVDGFGSKELRAGVLKELQAGGAKVARFRPLLGSLARRGASNYRNHRKMLVADGCVAWLGGRNLADKYLTSFVDNSHWIDLSLVVTGPAAAILEAVCDCDWHEASGQYFATPIDAWRRACTPGLSTVQVLPSGPDLEDDTLHATLLASVMQATRRIWISSPFFVPDDALHAALRLACRRGVELRIVVPQRSNQRFADWVRGSYLRDLQAVGARVFAMQGRMLHAKAVVVDDRLSIVGSANLDMRSLFTNHEICVVLYSCADVQAVAACIDAYCGASREGVVPVGFAGAVVSGALRITAPFV